MTTKTVIFLIVVCFIIGAVIGASKKTPLVNAPAIVTVRDTVTTTIRDTILRVQRDTIKIPVERIKYFTKTDTVTIRDSIISGPPVNCLTFPLLLSDSSVISVTECTAGILPDDLTFNAEYVDKRERIRIVENFRVDTLKQGAKRIGFTLGPSAGIGIDINNISKPVYFIGATLTYGWRF